MWEDGGQSGMSTFLASEAGDGGAQWMFCSVYLLGQRGVRMGSTVDVLGMVGAF